MKKNVFHTAILLLTSVMMAACSGNDDIVNNTNPEPQATTKGNVVVLSGTLGSKDSQTRTIATDGKGSWVEGDQFAIYYVTEDDGHASATATVNSINANGSANFTASLESPKTGNNGVTLIYPASAHDGNGGFETDALMEQEGTLDYINEHGLDIETATTTMNVEETAATLNSDVKMQPEVCLYTMNLRENSSYSNLTTTTKLVIKDNDHTYTITPTTPTNSFTVALLPIQSSGISFTATTNDETTFYTKQDDVTLANCTTDNVGDVFDEDGNIYRVSRGPGATYYKLFYGKALYAGKFYNSNVTLSKQIESFVGMIAYVGTHGTVDDSSTGPQTGYRGLAIAMNDCTQYNTSSWPSSSSSSFFSSGGIPTYCTQASATCTDEYNTDVTVAREWKDGITMTSNLVQTTSSHNHWAAKAANGYSKVRPSGTSNWFLPSLGQWQLIIQGLITKIDDEPYTVPIALEDNDKMKTSYFGSILVKAGAYSYGTDGFQSCYWSSSEYNSGYGWGVSFHSGHAFSQNKNTNITTHIRPVLAF